ncbi:MAG: DUF4835 family protein [FCB group bacterium]|nr:DUF4835 family protein [FCB group bacterium]
MKMSHKSLLFLMISFSGLLLSQFTEVEVTVDETRMRGESEHYLTNSLEEQMQTYLLNTRFAPDAEDIEMVINVRVVVESITDHGNAKVIKVQAVITNNLDQQFYAKGVDFPYSAGQSINFDTVYDPLAAFLDYYAFLLIAGELDTYYILGGTPYFSRAIQIADEGQTSAYSRGWQDRWKLARDINENVYTREAKYHFYAALDILFQPKAKKADLKEHLVIFHDKIMDVVSQIGNDRYTTVFLTAHAEEVARMMQMTEMYPELRDLMDFDLENKEIYQKYLPED